MVELGISLWERRVEQDSRPHQDTKEERMEQEYLAEQEGTLTRLPVDLRPPEKSRSMPIAYTSEQPTNQLESTVCCRN